MGTADTMPGVSGGTIALITGIYERLIHSISKINFEFVKPLLKGHLHESKTILKKEIDFELFIPLLLGIGIAILSMSRLMQFLLTNYITYTYAVFSGLILASAYIVYTEIDGFSVKNFIFGIIGFVFAFIFVGLNPIQANHSLLIIFFSGFVAICAMILPGISGAFVLLLLGQYEYMINALNKFSINEIITFVAGAGLGILSFSRILDYLLKNHESITMSFLVGLMLGTLRMPYQKISIADNSAIIFSVLLGIIAFGIVMLMEKKFRYIDY
jgi:putative membrane protein